MNKHQYFLKLADYAKQLFDTLPIGLEPKPLAYVLGILEPRIDEIKSEEVAKITTFRTKDKMGIKGNSNSWQGLNTIGMLMDRFTILLIREWSLRNKSNKDEAKADLIFKEQTLDIIEAMVNASPGSASLNSKITNLKQSVVSAIWEDAFYGLLTINLILWECQEILYIKDMKSLPCEELRDYIEKFAKGNIIRNEYIQLCEKLFWEI